MRKFFGLFGPRPQPVEEPLRYLVRRPQGRFTILDNSGWAYAIFDAEEGTEVFAPEAEKAAASNAIVIRDKKVRARFAHFYEPLNAKPYVYDAVLGKTVFTDASLQNCIDHAAALNHKDRESKQGVADWMSVAYALVRGRLTDTPSGWVIHEGSDYFDVVAAGGVIVARCASYPEAAHVIGLSDHVLRLTETYAPRGQIEV